jgi:hypothetical protein
MWIEGWRKNPRVEKTNEKDVILSLKDYPDAQLETILSMIATDGHDEVFEFLLEKGARANTVNNKGPTPLMEAALRGRAAVVKQLTSAGASINNKDRGGRTALDLVQDSRASRSFIYSDDLGKHQQRRTIVALGGVFPQPYKGSGITICMQRLLELANRKYSEYHQHPRCSLLPLRCPLRIPTRQ